MNHWPVFYPPSTPQVESSASRVAEYLRAVVVANRTVYQANVVDHLEAKGVARATRRCETDDDSQPWWERRVVATR